MRNLLALVFLAGAASAAAQALPDAPSSSLAASGPANPLPLVNGRHYRPPTQGEELRSALRRGLGTSALAGSAIGAAIQFASDRPDPKYWNTDAEGYGKRLGAAYGQRAVNAGTRYILGELLHEDNRYLICHGCSIRDKFKNAFLTDFTARHGADGHRAFSPTGIAAQFAGPMVAYAFWYPHEDTRYRTSNGARGAAIGLATRPAFDFLQELLDGHKVPFVNRKFWESPKRSEQVPAGWTGPMPPKRRRNPAMPDTATGYADPPDPPVIAKH